MPVINQAVVFKTGTQAQYNAATINENAVYWTTDTHRLFVGSNEFSKSYGGALAAEPTTATTGEIGKIYSYNGSVYACTNYDGSDYTWERIANVNDYIGTVTSVAAGEGLETGDGAAITASGTIAHAVPTGAAVTTAPISADQTPQLGDSFTIQSVATDKFGHATNAATYSVTLPGLNKVSDAETLASAATFAAVSGIETAEVDGKKVVKATTTTYTLPAAATYEFASTSEGKITVTPSTGTAYDVTINGWDQLAKKSELASVFTYKGAVDAYADLASILDPKVGDVWHVKATNSEYVYVEDPATAGTYKWEELGSAVDLSDYARTADVIARVTSATAGNVAIFTNDGQVSDSGKTPADLAETVASAPGAATDTDVYIVGSNSSAAATSSLLKSSDIKMNLSNGTITASTFSGVATSANKLDHDVTISVSGGATGTATAADLSGNGVEIVVSSIDATKVEGTLSNDTTGNAATATLAEKATADEDGNSIKDTYATKNEVANALVWTSI